MTEQKNSNSVGIAVAALGLAAAAFAAGWSMKKVTTFEEISSQAKDEVAYMKFEDLPEAEKELLDEQLSRGAQFLGQDGQKKLDEAFVIVVGVGGVGSHCAHFLARSGVRKLRVIDFDNVTLSSLNRHAVAGRSDVGTPKVVALAKHIKRFAPFCHIDCRSEMFTEERAEVLLEGNPDYVVDCIDDRNTKVALLAYCLLNKIKVLSSMAAGAKADPSRIHFTQFREVVRDPLAARLRWNLKQYLKNASKDEMVAFDKIEVLYSSELPHMKLLPLDSEVAEEDPSELGTVPNFRVRVMPVLGTMPAIFGMAMAARVITELAEKSFSPVSAGALKHNSAHKYRQKLATRARKFEEEIENSEEKFKSKWTDLSEWINLDLVNDDDCAAIISQFCQRCPITQKRMGSGPVFEIFPWRYDRPIEPDNLLLVSANGLAKIQQLLVERKLPTHTNLGISQEDFAEIIHSQYAVQTERQYRIEKENETAFQKGLARAVAHMNKDHDMDCLTLVKAYGEVRHAKSAEMVSMDRLGMVFKCKTASDETKIARVLFPSRLIKPEELRETVVKLTIQARADLAESS